MKVYSIDLRQKIIDTYENEKISQMKAVERGFKEISEVDIKSWFTHCCYCTV